MEKFRLLRADEIELRVGQVSKQDPNNFTVLLYKDARCDMAMLDETVGAENWCRDHKEIKGVLYCGVGIYNTETGEWAYKWDAGTESQTEKEKGEASDSFKRACVNWGIGRELYTAPRIWLKGDAKKFGWNEERVSRIEYNNQREITFLEICDKNNRVIFSHGTLKNTAQSDLKAKGNTLYVEKPKNAENAGKIVPTDENESPLLTQEEQDELTGIYADIDACETREQLISICRIYKQKRYIKNVQAQCTIKARELGINIK